MRRKAQSKTAFQEADFILGVAAVRVAQKLGPGHHIATLLCDSGSRHLSKFWRIAGNVGSAVGTQLEDVLEAQDHSIPETVEL